MDGQRLDEIARLLGAGASRRRVLRGLAVGVFGLAGAGATRSLASAQEAQGTCYSTGNSCAGGGADCCDNDSVCAGVPRICVSTLSCVGETGPCNEELGVFCCGDMVCDATDGAHGTCVVAEPTCGVDGDPCGAVRGDNVLECCEGYVCDEETSTCVAELTCLEAGDLCLPAGGYPCCEGLVCNAETGVCALPEEAPECETDEDCVGAAAGNLPICCAGVCRDIECCIDDEDPNARCPEGTSCFEGICEQIVCGHAGDECADSQDCCGASTCEGGICVEPEDDGGADVDHGDDEPVTQLPNTGVPGDGPANGLIAGVALAAGAAALLAGKKFRGGENQPAN